jgi:hypothetical protein
MTGIPGRRGGSATDPIELARVLIRTCPITRHYRDLAIPSVEIEGESRIPLE